MNKNLLEKFLSAIKMNIFLISNYYIIHHKTFKIYIDTIVSYLNHQKRKQKYELFKITIVVFTTITVNENVYFFFAILILFINYFIHIVMS